MSLLPTRKGLSPRVRGNRPTCRSEIRPSRTIPACAGEPPSDHGRTRNGKDYPRVCGGTYSDEGFESAVAGLSPRVRGNPPRRAPGHSERRDYPRVCGGTSGGDSYYRLVRGLSPRVRGNLTRYGAAVIGRRTIPACAGEPAALCSSPTTCRDYPRVCGGTRGSGSRRCLGVGLSPRVRGNRSMYTKYRLFVRTIPACAGEPPSGGDDHAQRRDYPRVCGGTASRRHQPQVSSGLSPRVRGNRWRKPKTGYRSRTIPACAGEPSAANEGFVLDGDYPRVCGGTIRHPSVQSQTHGLSPRVRGNPAVPAPTSDCERTIPACAGEPASTAAGNAGSKDYPRVCGGTRGRSVDSPSDVGLSPRVRGNR